MRRKNTEQRLAVVGGALFLALLGTSAGAAVAPERDSLLRSLSFEDPSLYIRDEYRPVAANPTVAAELASLGVSSRSAFLDVRTGRWATLLPATPLIPGTGVGNDLRWASSQVDPADLSAIRDAAELAFLRYVHANAAALRVRPDELASPNVTVHEDGARIHIWAPRQLLGIPVRDSYLTASINHGNLVLFGANRWSDLQLPTDPKVSEDAATQVLNDYLGPLSPGGSWRDSGLEIIPVSAAEGIGYRLVWALRPAFDHDLGRWEALVDAQNAELLSFLDTNQHATRKIVGGIYPVSNDGVPPDGLELLGYPMPFAEISTDQGLQVTNGAGHLPIEVSGEISWSGAGDFIRIVDICSGMAGINESARTGDIDLEGGPGEDCAIPAGHFPGDTHATRTGFHALNRIAELARCYIPAISWPTDQLQANMNIMSGSCDAFWNGSTVNFFHSGGGCSNTGELPGILDHEWGHGLDDNNTNPDISNPGEGTADLYPALWLNESCIGRGFFQAGNCTGYGDPCISCSGVRDIDFAMRQSGVPHDPDWAMSECPQPGGGPCGGSVHCEGAILAEAVWDLHARDLQAPPFDFDPVQALLTTTRLHFLGADNVGTWFTCDANGNDGCGVDGGYMQFLAADDDNGNINDGTPHMSAIHAAFNRHGIACNTPQVTDSGCLGAPTEAPEISADGEGSDDVLVEWLAVAGASAYNIYRSEFGCDAGSKKLVATTSELEYLDENATTGNTYYYCVLPVGSDPACIGPPSNCEEARPTGGGPTKLTAGGQCPGDVELTYIDGTPGGNAAIIYSSLPGADPIPAGVCAGIPTGLSSPSLLTVVTLDGAGGFGLIRTAPPAVCGFPVQVVDVSTCDVSNVATLP